MSSSSGISAEALGLSSAHISAQHDFTVQYAEGGTVVENNLFPACGDYGGRGGVRGKVTSFSRASRRRMLNLVNSINKERAPLPTLVTLTSPSSWPESPHRWKEQLDNFRSRLVRRYGKVPVGWRLEYQRRGGLQFHLLVFVELEADDLLPFVARNWYEVASRSSGTRPPPRFRVYVPDDCARSFWTTTGTVSSERRRRS